MDSNPYESPATNAADDSRSTRWFLLAFYSLAIIWGLRTVYLSKPSSLDLLVPVALAICLGLWAIVDANHRRRPIPMSARWWFFLLSMLVVPGYVIWSRGWRGIALVALHVMGWYGLAFVVMCVGGTLMFGGDWWASK